MLVYSDIYVLKENLGVQMSPGGGGGSDGICFCSSTTMRFYFTSRDSYEKVDHKQKIDMTVGRLITEQVLHRIE